MCSPVCCSCKRILNTCVIKSSVGWRNQSFGVGAAECAPSTKVIRFGPCQFLVAKQPGMGVVWPVRTRMSLKNGHVNEDNSRVNGEPDHNCASEALVGVFVGLPGRTSLCALSFFGGFRQRS